MSTKFQESESEVSAGESSVEGTPTIPPQPPPRTNQKKKARGQQNWEVLEGLKEGQTYDRIPKRFEGFVLKKRKWPLKGYHKRYFVLEVGLISYGKTGWDIARGKVHGTLDSGLCVISTKPREGRIDIDAEDSIYHIKIKPKEVYMEWIEQLKQHRLYRQHLMSIKSPIQPLEVKENSLDHEINLVEKDIFNLQGILDKIDAPKDNNKDKMRDFVVVAKDVVVSLNGIIRSITKVKENDGMVTLKHTLNVALQQNAEFKTKLAKIAREATFLEYPAIKSSDTIKSYSSVSNSEYYDAITNIEDRTSSDEESISDDASINSENSEQAKFDEVSSVGSRISAPISPNLTSIGNRRSILPSSAPTESIGLWGILRKNIGKDLSRVSMPVALNEPLGVLQRMCEQFEYSELLEQACKEPDPIERMAYVAAWTVSGYANSAFRTHKPFNPLLGETFECERQDKGFRFVSEQVCHHPPISTCYADGKNWKFWEETQPKTKFWGKSMEIQPIGSSHLLLTHYNDHYVYNKATTCVHNLFSPQNRSVEIYGQVVIENSEYRCMLTYTRSSVFNSRKHEVVGSITKEGLTLRNLFGRWNEVFYSGQAPSAKILWRMGAMPEEYTKYYGFTRFAIELNDPLCDNVAVTDTRLRPDQRLLEEGDLAGAEQMKMTLEQNQRDRRKKYEEDGLEYKPKWFRKSNTGNGSEWEFNGLYWESKKNSFKNIEIEQLW